MLLLASGTAAYYFIFPSYENLKVLEKENEALLAVVDEMKGLVDKKNELYDLYNSVSEGDRKKINELVPSNPKLAEYLVKLDILTSRNGVSFSSVNFGDPSGAPDAPYMTSVLSLALSGSYETFKIFLKDLEKYVRIIDVDSFGFSAPAEQGAPLSVSFSARTYQAK